jgi:hypothetical protein
VCQRLNTVCSFPKLKEQRCKNDVFREHTLSSKRLYSDDLARRLSSLDTGVSALNQLVYPQIQYSPTETLKVCQLIYYETVVEMTDLVRRASCDDTCVSAVKC